MSKRSATPSSPGERDVRAATDHCPTVESRWKAVGLGSLWPVPAQSGFVSPPSSQFIPGRLDANARECRSAAANTSASFGAAWP